MRTDSLCGQGVRVTAASSLCALLQLVRECKEVLKGGLLMKQYYQFMLQEVLDGLEKTDCNMDAFEEDLQKMLLVSKEGVPGCVQGVGVAVPPASVCVAVDYSLFFFPLKPYFKKFSMIFKLTFWTSLNPVRCLFVE